MTEEQRYFRLAEFMSAAAERQIDSFLRKYTPDVASQLRASQERLRTIFPRGFELVYDNYNALVFGFGPTDRASDAVLSLAGYPKWVTLFFLKGSLLQDPNGLLDGKGKLVRSIRLQSAHDLSGTLLRALIEEAVRPCASSFLEAPTLTTIVKSVSAKQRARRPTGASTRK